MQRRTGDGHPYRILELIVITQDGSTIINTLYFPRERRGPAREAIENPRTAQRYM
jgi:hypothetical protein